MDEGLLTGTGMIQKQLYHLKAHPDPGDSSWKPPQRSSELLCVPPWAIAYSFLFCQGGPSRIFQAFIILFVYLLSPVSLSSLLEGTFNSEQAATRHTHSNRNDPRPPGFSFSVCGIVAHMETRFNFLKCHQTVSPHVCIHCEVYQLSVCVSISLHSLAHTWVPHLKTSSCSRAGQGSVAQCCLACARSRVGSLAVQTKR